MDIFTRANDLLNRGIATAGRETKALSLRAQVKDLSKRREGICASLGASLYEDENILSLAQEKCPDLCALIAQLDDQTKALEAEIAEIEAVATQTALTASATPVASKTCSACGTPMGDEDKFCMSCGAKVEAPNDAGCGETERAANGEEEAPSTFCPACGEAYESGSKYCAHCGASLQ